MGTNTLQQVNDGDPATEDDVNQYFTALTGNLVPRDPTTGVPEDNENDLGSLVTQWRSAYINNLYIGGTLFDPDNLGIDANFAIVSGATRATSEQPDFVRATGAGAVATILATATALQITAGGTSVTVSADISVTGLTVAPASNNTATINDATLAGGALTKYTGESISEPITVSSMGTEISNRVGQYVCLKTAAGEYMLAYVESTTKLSRVYRGFFFDDSGDPIVRGTLTNTNALTIMSLGWVFLDSNGSTVDVSYRSPFYQATTPSGGVTDDYWFDLTNRLWKRYDGATWQTVSRMLIGLVVIDGTNCVASRSFDFSQSYSNFNSVGVTVFSTTKIYSTAGRSALSVYGEIQEFSAGPMIWDITADLESGVTEGSSTTYYLYVTEEGEFIISDERYYDRRNDLNGYYHPYNSWRCVGECYNDGSSNLTQADKIEAVVYDVQKFTGSGTWTKPIGATKFHVMVQAGGGGGGGANVSDALEGAGGAGGGGGECAFAYFTSGVGKTETVTIGASGAAGNSSGGNGGTGGTTSFGTLLTAIGGTGGNGTGASDTSPDFKTGGAGGTGGTGGDYRSKGGAGFPGFTRLIADEPAIAGNGGTAHMGGGGLGIVRLGGGGTDGGAGGNYGGGGGGGAHSNATGGAAGGAGGAGLLTIISMS